MAKLFDCIYFIYPVSPFRFSQALHDVLCDALGVGSVEDLNLIYTDEDLIKEVENNVTKIEYKRFLKARLYTNVDAPPPEPKLADSVLRDAHPPAPPMPIAVPLSSLPTADREEMARKDLAHAIAASDAERLERETRERIDMISRRRTKIKGNTVHIFFLLRQFHDMPTSIYSSRTPNCPCCFRRRCIFA